MQKGKVQVMIQISEKLFPRVLQNLSNIVCLPQVQNLLQLFNVPQIGYSATSKDLR